MLLIWSLFINVGSGAQREDAACPSPRVIVCRDSQFRLPKVWHLFLPSGHELPWWVSAPCSPLFGGYPEPSSTCLSFCLLNSSRYRGQTGLRKVVKITLKSFEPEVNNERRGKATRSTRRLKYKLPRMSTPVHFLPLMLIKLHQVWTLGRAGLMSKPRLLIIDLFIVPMQMALLSMWKQFVLLNRQYIPCPPSCLHY